MLERRITYRRSSAYRTRSNNFRAVKTPGGRLILHLIKKHVKGNGIQGVKVARPHDMKRMNSSRRSVSRAYGGIFTATEVREKIMRAFLIEEFKRFKNINAGKTEKKDKKKSKKAKKEVKK